MSAALEASRTGTPLQPSLGYARDAKRHDLMFDAEGRVRSAYTPVSDWFSRTAPEAQRARAQRCSHLLFDNFSDPQLGHQPWHLDLVPLMLSPDTFRHLETAALQRARLYRAMLTDIYGPQRLVRDGVIPAELLLNDPSYLRRVHASLPTEQPLTFLALDFACDPRGNWRVLDAHAETPAGHGFALANRMIMVEIARDLFTASRSRRINLSYQALTEDLYSQIPTEDPTIAILTGSADSDADLGHAYMARYLGFLRVTGADLRVVDDHVYLKTIDGLKRIDLLVRAIEGRKADPLELSPTGFDGPVGLLDATRRNPGLVTNAIGTAVIENRGLSPYLASAAEKLLSETLTIPDAPRYWLGEPNLRANVLRNLEASILHSAHEGTGRPGQAKPGQRYGQLDDAGRARLLNDLSLRPATMVAETPIGFATAPSWSPDGLKPEPFAVRIFVVASNDGFVVMPGGVALTIDDEDAVALTSHTARSRDVWVVEDGDEPLPPVQISLQSMARTNTVVQRHARDLQSRVADNLFWLGRYCERADASLRVVRQTLIQSAPDLTSAAHLKGAPLVLEGMVNRGRAAHEVETENGGFSSPDNADKSDTDALTAASTPLLVDVLSEICGGQDNDYGLPRTIDLIRQTAHRCRDRLSMDSWRTLSLLNAEGLVCQPSNVHSFDARAAQSLPPHSTVLANGDDVIQNATYMIGQLSAFAGMVHENMTRNRGWQFLDIGRRIERARQMAELIAILFSSVGDPDEEREALTYALGVADSYMTFRARYRFAPELKLVLDLLLVDETNPRGIAYQLATLASHIDQLPKSASDSLRARDQRLALELLTRTRLLDLDRFILAEPDRSRPELSTYCAELVKDLAQLSEVLSRNYFSLIDDQPQRLQTEFTRPTNG